MIDNLLSITLIAGFLYLLKLLGYAYERLNKPKVAKSEGNAINYIVLSDSSDELCVGGNRLILSQMEEIIKEKKTSHSKISFYEGKTKPLASKYAFYKDGKIHYLSGKVVELT